jgi:hypothetical protein
MRDQGELPRKRPTLQELVDVIRAIEGSSSALEGKETACHTDEMTLTLKRTKHGNSEAKTSCSCELLGLTVHAA